MNREAIGAVGEVVGAIAVVLTLVYLAVQLRQNTSQIRKNTKAVQATAFDSSITHAMVARQAVFENQDVARIYHQGTIDPKTLSEEELLRYRLAIHNVLWSMWNIYSQVETAALASESWQAQVAVLRRLMSSAGPRWFWANHRDEFGRSFQEAVEQIYDSSS
jgi:hypothetical protein